MRGKNKLILVLFALMAIVASAVGFSLYGRNDNIRYAKAETINGYSALLEGNIIFSAEKVYFASVWADDGDEIPEEDEVIGWDDNNHNGIIEAGEFEDETADLNDDGKIDSGELQAYNTKVRESGLQYNGYDFKAIYTKNGPEYFGDFGLNNGNGVDYSHRYVINDGEFVMVDDRLVYSAEILDNPNTEDTESGSATIKQGIMITLGGYYWDNDTQQYTLNGEDSGAGLNYVSAQATLNGNPIELPNARGYHNSSYQDFTFFIIPSEATEGHYEISVMYPVKGLANPIRYDFDFYLLLQSSYDKEVEVNSQKYSSSPTMGNAPRVNKQYNFFSGTSLNYPTVTFDYSRYALRYTHVSGDVTTEVVVDYDSINNNLSLSKLVYNDKETQYYKIGGNIDNTIVTLMFVDHGKYTFHFDYIYQYKGERIVIPQEQIPFEDITLNIYGYQLKYSKTGFASADMTYLEIYRNNTMFILANGFIDANNQRIGDNLGVHYTLIDGDTTKRTGTVKDVDNITKNEGSESASILRSEKDNSNGGELDIDGLINAEKIASNDEGKVLTKRIEKIQYQRTDRGLWLTLNDEYELDKSFYYHSASPIGADFVKAYDNTKQIYTNRKAINKVTTFTAPGYYLIQVKYKYNVNSIGTQWFAFQITSTTPMLELYKTALDDLGGNIEGKTSDFYAHEFTNQNVFATWAETEVFESSVVGKLYYAKNDYASKSKLKAVADGAYNSSVTKEDYVKKTLIKDSASYLLVLEVERSASKTYTYFTIDKEKIGGLQVYEVIANSVDNRAVYSIKRDADLNYISHTSKGVVDADFTLDWADKRSGAAITGTYKITPFVKKTQLEDMDRVITIESGSNVYKYVINEYGISGTSNDISIQKPLRLNSALDINNVLTDQGIYEFNLEDQAGNKLTYIVVLDRTEAVIKATYSDNKTKYNSGQRVADYVEVEWGTHKAVDLGVLDNRNDNIKKLLSGNNKNKIENYYEEKGNNLTALYRLFQTVGVNNLFVVQNLRTEIRMDRFDQYKDYYYMITDNGSKQVKYPNGAVTTGWDSLANYLFENVTNAGIKINVDLLDEGEDHIYMLNIVGGNQVTVNSGSEFTVRITPDEALGEVYSSSSTDSNYETYVDANGMGTDYFSEEDKSDKNINHQEYYDGQASNDGAFVFEWAAPRDEDNFKVVEVKYNYYQLMDQAELNSNGIINLTKDKLKKDYPYYPYKYLSTNYILQTQDEMEVVSQYNRTTRIVEDDKGNLEESRSVNRSTPINLAYETYYNSNGELITKQVTQTGLYIITRIIEMKVDAGNKTTPIEYSYAFFVDRNKIVGYSLTEVNVKIVGQFIHTAMPNSKSDGGVVYETFNKKGLANRSYEYKGDTINYQVYLETNKLPSKLKVPSGKYVSGDIENKTINATSSENLKLKVSVYFRDSYSLLPDTYKNSFIRLMKDMTVDKNSDGYIDLSFSNIDDPAIITIFRQARIHNEDNSLSLPGEYAFVIEDNVGWELDNNFQVKEGNKFIFGIKLTNESPETDVYSYAEIDKKTSSKTYAGDDKTLYTNQQYVDFIIPVEDLQSYKAQLDIANVEVWRSGANGGNGLWLRLKSDGKGGFVADTNALEQTLNRVEEVVDKDNNVTAYKIKLDTGLEVVDNKIISYKEYVYTININYVLVNSSNTKYYTYRSDGFINSFYTSAYTVTIDRTPNSANLDALMKQQGTYFKQYHNWLAEQNNTTVGNINQNFAYRSTTSVADYYGLANKLYYEFATTVGTLSNQAMYALSVDELSTFNPNGLSAVYYRKLDFNNSEVVANARMGLLQITDAYINGSGYYHTFNENLSAYNMYSTLNDMHKDDKGNIYYSGALLESNNNYDDKCGSFYEIIEKDLAGNYTQYVIYFAPESEEDVKITVNGDDIRDNKDGNVDLPLTFRSGNTIDDGVFIGINKISSITGLANSDNGQSNPYYGNINIYNASREKIKTIYINSTTDHDSDDGLIPGLESEIHEVIKNQGNYIFEYINVFNQSKTLIINNYTSVNKLNIGMLKVKTDSMTGQKYIQFSELNSKVDNGVYWFVKEVKLIYNSNTEIVYTSTPPEDGKTVLELSSGKEGDVVRDDVEKDRLNLKKDMYYLVVVTDVGGKKYTIPLSTGADYAYELMLPENVYSKDNIYYTANQVQIAYNTNFYDYKVLVWEDGIQKEISDDNINNEYYKVEELSSGNYKIITLKPNAKTEPADFNGSVRKFQVVLELKENEDDTQNLTYDIYIDTSATEFKIENINKVDKIDFIKSTLKNSADENGAYQDYNVMDLNSSKFYGTLISETVNISWTRLTSDYFTYNYELFEFTSKDEYRNLLKDSNTTEYSIAPKENTTGKYVLKVTIEGKDGKWIATRVYGIFMSTTITGLYEVKDGDGELYDYNSITNLKEIKDAIGGDDSAMAKALGFVKGDGSADISAMTTVFKSFGDYTAIPMYIANTELTLHSNKDNGVDCKPYTRVVSSYAQITLYRVWRSNYYTFAVIMKVESTDKNQNILKTLSFTTSSTKDGESLLNNGIAKVIYDSDAEFYKLTFSSYNQNTATNPLERHNIIVIDVYYNNIFAKRVRGDINEPTTPIEFKNSGSYKLVVRDLAGNTQWFSNNSSTVDSFTVIVMKEVLYTINGEAPVQYAYYDSDVTLQINRYNDATGKNNYDINTIRLSSIRNNSIYSGYVHPTESATYVFKDYGTYLITITANLLGTNEPVSSQLVFTILNPNEARRALDFTSICGYNIISVFSITKTAEKDVTNKFMELLRDKSNMGEISVYNKLVTYERVSELFGTSTQGKMKFRVLYEVQNDNLLPARRVEFSFTLNNESATLNSSINAGGKTTKPVTIQFNAANIYDQIGDCNLVVNGEVVLRIDENSVNAVRELQLTNVGKYYVQLVGDSGNVATSFNFTIKEPLNTVSIILIVVVSAIVIALIGTFIWLRTRMKVR